MLFDMVDARKIIRFEQSQGTKEFYLNHWKIVVIEDRKLRRNNSVISSSVCLSTIAENCKRKTQNHLRCNGVKTRFDGCKTVNENPKVTVITFRNRTTIFLAVYTSVLDGNKNSKIYFYPPVDTPFHNSCTDNVYTLDLFVAIRLEWEKWFGNLHFGRAVMSPWCHCAVGRI